LRGLGGSFDGFKNTQARVQYRSGNDRLEVKYAPLRQEEVTRAFGGGRSPSFERENEILDFEEEIIEEEPRDSEIKKPHKYKNPKPAVNYAESKEEDLFTYYDIEGTDYLSEEYSFEQALEFISDIKTSIPTADTLIYGKPSVMDIHREIKAINAKHCAVFLYDPTIDEDESGKFTESPKRIGHFYLATGNMKNGDCIKPELWISYLRF
jgi:hypothetical protein